MSETRTLSVHASIVYNLVTAQAGTLGKAILECIMNSIDAGASQVDIKLDKTSVIIQDDGQGFRSRAEIENWFEVFGFPHEDNSRVYGQFGIGRAQLWSFCSTLWRTNTFEMSVDIKNKGLNYELKEKLPKVKGVEIKGSFYKSLLLNDIAEVQRELQDLAKYAQIPVILNGKQINKNPLKEKWDFETDDAWIRLSDSGQLAVYNLGVLVRRYQTDFVGSGGIVLTKPGVRLALNMARNDILVSKCEVWKRLKPLLQQKSDDRVGKKNLRLTYGEIENIAHRYLAGDVPYAQVKDLKLILDISAKEHSLESFIRTMTSWRAERFLPLTLAPKGSMIGERAHTRKMAFVLSPLTLEFFGAETVTEFVTKLASAVERQDAFTAERLSKIRVEEELEKAVPSLKEGYEIIPRKELSARHRAALSALTIMSAHVAKAIHRNKSHLAYDKIRKVHIGVSDVADAWTDGIAYIVFNKDIIELFDRGIGGISGLTNLMVHEYLHDESDIGSHIHDFEFYKQYHDMTEGRSGELDQAILAGLISYMQNLGKEGSSIKKSMLMQCDRLTKVAAQTALKQ